MGRKEKDIFDIVKQRKDDIDKRQVTADRRERKVKEKDNPKKRGEPGWREKALHLRRNRLYRNLTVYSQLPASVRKVLAGREKSNNPLNVEDTPSYNAPRSITNNVKRLLIVESTKPVYHCPRCGICKTNLSDWYVEPKKDWRKEPLDLMMNKKPQRKVLCRSCVRQSGWDFVPKVIPPDIKLYSKVIKRYKISAIDLSRKRVAVSKTIQQFAGLVGWTSDYQYQLENGNVMSLNESAMGDLVAAFARMGVELSLNVWGEAMERYVLNGKLIKLLRISRGLSLKGFAMKCGWSKTYQHRIETSQISARKTKLQIIRTSLTDC